jgi:microcystin-dependent protein
VFFPLPPGPPLPFVGLPVGAVIAFAGQVASSTSTGALELARTGWLICDGRALKIAQYPELHAVLGALYAQGGEADDVFRLPDLGGQFLRGVTDDAKLDPDPDQRKRADGSAGAGQGADQYVGTFQGYALQDHAHGIKAATLASVNSQDPQVAVSGTTDADTEAVHPLPGQEGLQVSPHETRARNMGVYFIIKYTNLSAPWAGLPLRPPTAGGPEEAP